MRDLIWTKTRPDGRECKVFHLGVIRDSYVGFAVEIDGKPVADGAFKEIDRRGYLKNAPAGATHVIGDRFCFMETDATELTEVANPLIEAHNAERTRDFNAKEAASESRRAKARETMVERCVTRGIDRAEAVEFLGRYGWEDARAQTAFDREDMDGFRVLIAARAAGDTSIDKTPVTKSEVDT